MNKLYKQFLINNRKCIKDYINSNYNPKTTTLKYTKYISNSNLEKTLDVIFSKDEQSKVLLIAPTGSGKTRFISDYMDKHSDKFGCLFCPNKIQNLGNENYGFKSLVENKSLLDDDTKISSVYDKANEVYDKIKSSLDVLKEAEYNYNKASNKYMDKEVVNKDNDDDIDKAFNIAKTEYNNRIRREENEEAFNKAKERYDRAKGKRLDNGLIAIDEAHYIVESQFRKKSIKEMERVADISQHVIYLTATPYSLFLH